MLDSKKYYGVYIPKDSNECSDSNDEENVHVYTSYEQAAVVLKEVKNARFKFFNSESEACYFAQYGSVGGQGTPNISESTQFKSLKRPDVYKFRLCIERGDYTSVKKYIWENPRYLISICDTPTLMQEGPRYNALHIVAKHNRAKLAELILSTVSDPNFSKLLYGTAGENSYITRSQVFVDLYLNTPDRSLNETPLHFAAKCGALDVITVFVEYPQLKVEMKNKYNQTAADLACKQMGSESTQQAEKIRKMLGGLFHVPLWGSNDDSVQPIIGRPYSPKTPPVCPMVVSPVSPSMEIRAVAGPMTYDEAINFHKTWKSPVRSNSSSPSTPHPAQGVLLRNPLEMERAFEKVGRALATQFHVSWKEYWPFLDKLVDMRSEEGLKSFEDFLKQKIISERPASRDYSNSSILSPISDLCYEFAKCSITSPVTDKSNCAFNDRSGGDASNSPYLLIENLCVMFAENVLDIFMRNFTTEMSIEENVAALITKVRNLTNSLDACKKDLTFKDFPFGKIHTRAALWITRKLLKFEKRHLIYATATFNLIDQTDANTMREQITLSPGSANVEMNRIVQILKCINGHIIKLLKGVVTPSENENNEEKCRKEWSSVGNCQCDNNDGFFSKLHRLTGGFKPRLLFPDEDVFRKNVGTDSKNTTNESVSSVTDLADSNNDSQVTNKSDVNCNNIVNLRNEVKICDISECDSDDDEFFTPPSSSQGSEDDMDSPDEGPDIFIYDYKGTSLDNAVLEAIADLEIDRNVYPNIYRWKHSIQLHHPLDRFTWPSPRSSKVIKKRT